jgi:hypothetical protein
MGLSSFEGEIYRALDKLIDENNEIIKGIHLDVTKNSAGYDIYDVKRKDGSFDLTPLFVGSQGTLGIVSEITLSTEADNPDSPVYFAMAAVAFGLIIDELSFIRGNIGFLPKSETSAYSATFFSVVMITMIVIFTIVLINHFNKRRKRNDISDR